MPPACPRCGAELETTLACSACGELLALPAEARDPFALLGLERGYELDPTALRKRLLRLSRLVHPDFFGAADAATRQRAEDASAALNGAYEVLADDARRADWLIDHLQGPREADEREMPRAFLMEVLEWNEQLEEARRAPHGSPPRAALASLASSLRAERDSALQAVRSALVPLPSPAAPALTDARRQLNAIRYVDRALREIEALRLEEAASR